MKPTLTLFSTAIILLAAACSKNQNGNSSGTDHPPLAAASLTVTPVDTTEVLALVPLGNLNPPAHTYPTDHMYFYGKTPNKMVDLKAPGNARIWMITRTRYNPGMTGSYDDYAISIGNSKTHLYFGHVKSISSKLLAAVNNFSGASCGSYSTGGISVQQCYLNVSIDITAGETIGTINSGSMDMGSVTSEVASNPLDFFSAAPRAMLENKLGRFDGKLKRTAAPIWGEINQDITGTAQGVWIKQGGQRNPEDNNLALVKDNIDPSWLGISTGNGIAGLSPDVYYFQPQSAGLINRSFADVKVDGNTYCFTLGTNGFPYPGSRMLASASVIIKLESATTLSVEKRNCDCTCLPYAFTAGKTTFTR